MQGKKERFTSLFHHISIDLLRLAFFELKRNAAPGVESLAIVPRTNFWAFQVDDVLDRPASERGKPLSIGSKNIWRSSWLIACAGRGWRGPVCSSHQVAHFHDYG
jgi:hypothetical protein